MKLWTAWCDYYATGEGRALLGWIGHAQDRSDALRSLGDAFDPYFAAGADAAEGVVGNEAIGLLFSQRALDDVRSMQSRATVQLTGRLHFNFA